ncbi:dynamin family protein [Tychonema sp. LEGE 07199]|uniref:dynamin family protein n=1 Tax=unclassified Tychonema TaxID=2642144 RepID=UPI0018800E0B|nr:MULTISPECIES: dynamin family protein [unclassified Tychonema]MBE9121738.1 dynamin family protein [Tychonema sp. LEGE 07199]MBE9133842.1 dynamin family protein [Tychonema sp. LEGE 07196]
MDTSLISPQTFELVSLLTGQKLRKEDITPPLLFLAALVTVLLGVIHADGTVSAEEKQRLRTTFTELIPANNSLGQFVRPMVKSVQDRQVYNKVTALLALTACFSEEEKLLLISFGYQMSAADGTIEERAKQYLTIVANRLGIAGRYLTVLEASFSDRAIGDTAALAEVHSLLDPARFQSLDSLFVRAASHIIEHLPAKPKQQKNRKHSVSSYQELKKFQEYRQQLNAVCGKLYLTLLDGSDRNVLSASLTEEVTKISRKLESQCFRVAVVGEFSKGKSTLLNALLGEEIQPVRDIPCSGTVTVLKYGPQQRVICKYTDGREEEISPEQYKDKASISEEAALGSFGDEIVKSEITEIIFEHPNLELCTNGVEIIDSPGLNEQAERTLVTEQVLKTTDAVIFLTHAQNALTEKERELLLYLKKELNPDRDDEAAKSIFILVNFADLLRREESRKQVRQRVETIVKSQNAIAGENRIHFISAQSALEAILNGTENEYLKSFQDFTKSLEQFLTVERGAIALQQSVAGIKQIINTGCDELSQYREMLEGKLTVSQGDKLKIFELMAEASGRDVKIKLLADELMEKCVEEAIQSWNEWLEGLGQRLIAKSALWTSDHSHMWSQKELTKDYSDQFVEDITQEIEDWATEKVQSILQQNMGALNSQIDEEISAIRQEFQKFDKQLSSNLVSQFNNLAMAGNLGEIGTSGSGIAESIDDIGDGGFMGGLGIGAVAAAVLIALPLGIIPVILGTIVAGLGGGLGWSFLDGDTVKAQIKEKVCELGFENFDESSQSIFDKIQERIIALFEKRIETSNNVMSKAISVWENLLEQQEKCDRQNQAECESQKVWLAEKRRELEQVQNQIEAILNQSDR